MDNSNRCLQGEIVTGSEALQVQLDYLMDKLRETKLWLDEHIQEEEHGRQEVSTLRQDELHLWLEEGQGGQVQDE